MPRLQNPAPPVNFTRDAWVLLTVCDTLDDASFFRERFLDLVAARPTAIERDHLLARGLGHFGYTLAEALAEVETRVLDAMLGPS